MERQHLIVHGKVQGVGFRYYTRQKAKTYRIRGWVRNNPTGTVEIEAQGNRHDLQQFIATIKQGSPHSDVRHVEVRHTQDPYRYKSFKIVR